MKLNNKDLASIRSHLRSISFMADEEGWVDAGGIRDNVELIEDILDRNNGKEREEREEER